MFTYLVRIIINIPFWVYPLFGFLVWNGIKASKKRTVSPIRISILPSIFLTLFCRKMIQLFPDAKIEVLIMTSFFMISLCITYWVFLIISLNKINVNKKTKLIDLPGTWITLVLAMTIFSLHFIAAVLAKEGYLENPYIILLLKSISTGIALGRVLPIFQKVIYGPYVDSSSSCSR